MMKRSLSLVGLLLVVLGLSLGASTTFAQPYPNRPIQLIIPGAAGSILDIAGRGEKTLGASRRKGHQEPGIEGQN